MVTINEEENKKEAIVYVVIGKSQSNIEALSLTFNNLATPSTMLYLIGMSITC